MQFNRTNIDSFGRFTNTKYDNVKIRRTKTVEMEKRNFNPEKRFSNRSVVLKIFGEFYSLITYSKNRIGDLRKTMSVWMDLNPTNVIINAFVGNVNVRTNIKCFNGWNRRGLGNHVGKVLGLKNGIFRINTNGEIEDLRSVWNHGDFN
jgi:hypothetical protein